MKYTEICYKSKIESLLDMFSMSTKLAEALTISRTSLVNWISNPDSISTDNRFNIDVLYCKHFVIPEWDKPKQSFKPMLLPDAMPNNHNAFMPFLRQLSYGTIEIETGISKEDFDRAIDAKKLPKNMTVEVFHEAFNTFITLRGVWEKIVEHEETFNISEESIKGLHDSFMRGIHDSSGFYSENVRIMGQLENFSTTWPEDIPDAMNSWVYKYKHASSLEELVKAHAHFIAIHPFGDGNGRVGRALVMAQCLNARLMPPIFNGQNRAIYFAAMEHAMLHGRHIPLIRLFHEAATR